MTSETAGDTGTDAADGGNNGGEGGEGNGETDAGDGDGDDNSGDGDGDDNSGDGDGDDNSGDGDGDGDGDPSVCGDGIVSANEECDDLNADNTDDCTDSCLLASCGDGYLWAGNEGCDDGNLDDTDDCTSACTIATCGDGVAWANNEACDDGNGDDTDGCTSACIEATCGDGLVWVGNETCDDGNDGDDHDECLDGCVAASCGDGFIWAGNENCDDGNADPDDGCDTACLTELYFVCVDEGPNTCDPIRILYAVADSDDQAFRDSVALITEGPVDYFDTSSDTPTLMQLQGNYDCVFTHSSTRFSNAMSMGTVLRDYADVGGSVVLGVKTDHNPNIGLNGTPIMAIGYSPISTAGSTTDGQQDYSGDGVSVLHTDVEAYGIGETDNAVVLQGDGLQDGSYGNGAISTAYRPDFKIVYLNGTGSSTFSPSGDWDRLVANACGAGYVLPP
jgi:cysteine-rich repeat protein